LSCRRSGEANGTGSIVASVNKALSTRAIR